MSCHILPAYCPCIPLLWCHLCMPPAYHPLVPRGSLPLLPSLATVPLLPSLAYRVACRHVAGTEDHMNDIASVLARAIMRRRQESMLDEEMPSPVVHRDVADDWITSP